MNVTLLELSLNTLNSLVMGSIIVMVILILLLVVSLSLPEPGYYYQKQQHDLEQKRIKDYKRYMSEQKQYKNKESEQDEPND